MLVAAASAHPPLARGVSAADNLEKVMRQIRLTSVSLFRGYPVKRIDARFTLINTNIEPAQHRAN